MAAPGNAPDRAPANGTMSTSATKSYSPTSPEISGSSPAGETPIPFARPTRRPGGVVERQCLAYGEISPHIREQYHRLALVSHPRHLEALDADDTDTLIVAHGWLLWQEAAAAGRHCVHYEMEAFGGDRPPQASDIFLRTHDWLYADGEDPTLFRGVSLGRLFSRELSLVIMERERLSRALDALIARYSPDELVFFDFRAEHSVIDADGRLGLVAERAQAYGIGVTDRSDPPDGDDPALPFAEFYGRHERWNLAPWPWLEAVPRGAFKALAGGLGWLWHKFFSKKPAVLLVSTHLTALPLLENFGDRGLLAMVLADWYPRKRNPMFVARNFAKGIVPVTCRQSRLDKEDSRRLERIEAMLTTEPKRPPTGHAAEIRRYVRDYVVAPGRLRGMAREVRWAERLLLRHRPDVVLSDGLDYYLCHVFFILAKSLGIATAATWHAPYIQDVKMGILGCDPRIACAVDWFFSWGKVNDGWLDAIGAKAEIIRAGNPVALRSRGGKTTVNSRKRALLLQYAGTGEDHVSPQAIQYNFFVDAVRMLRDLGYSEIRLKVHPGAYSMTYYQMVADAYGLDVSIYKNEPFQDLVNWADIVIGPVVSGAMLEVLGTGKPYYPVLLVPGSVNMDYLKGHPVFLDVAELRGALERTEPPNFAGLLDEFASLGQIPNPAQRTWEVLRSKLIEPPLNV